MKGSLDDPDNIVITPQQIWLNDIGTGGHTQFSNNPDAVVEMYERFPEFMMSRMGLIHSHNSMSVFFSGEDVDELHDNSGDVDFYFSLITNNRGDYEGRVSTIRIDDVEVQTHVMSRWQRTGERLKTGDQKNTQAKKLEVLHMVKLEVEAPPGITMANGIILERLKFVRSEEEKKVKTAKPVIYHGWEDEVNLRDERHLPSIIRPSFDDVKRSSKRIPKHVSDKQLDLDGKMVEENTAFDYEMKDIIAKLLVGNSAYEGSLKKAIKKVCEEVDDAFAPDYVDHLFNVMEDIYIETTDEQFMSNTMEIMILTFISENVPDDCKALTKLKERAREDLIDAMS